MSAPVAACVIVAGWIVGSFVLCGLYGAGRACERRQRRTVVACHQPRPRPTLPADVDGECRELLTRAGLEKRQ